MIYDNFIYYIFLNKGIHHHLDYQDKLNQLNRSF